jgi:thiosulfate/3-mercaptopyruvate sulfurtransferase
MSNFVTAKWLYENLNNKDIVIVDCRADLFDKEYGSKVYSEGHIRGAFFLDVKKDLAGEPEEHGGRSPLPDLEVLKEKLENVGISEDSIIVAYDEVKLAGAERLWWMLKYLGHCRVHILNGGINSWLQEGYPTVREVPKADKGTFNIKLNENIITNIVKVREIMNDKDYIIVDSRAPERYRGEIEPIDKKAGHIPGAVNYHWKDVLNEKEQFKCKKELEEHFKELEKYKKVVLQCGSGIDACGNFVAMDEVGFKPKLYLGSWSDWVSYEDSPIAIGEE